MSKVSFKVSSALKNIIGKELITDDFIAVFELVKNSFDANARRVEIIFQELTSKNRRIIIKDDGAGMNQDDIRNKWLFVAYSAKKIEQDYRDKIKSPRIFAGAKGIGRFSCDRLGAKLRLITKKKNESTYNILEVDWNKFEENSEKEFQTIEANLTKHNTTSYPEFQSGTLLEISDLRDNDWNREKFIKLRRSLERLINPNQGNDANNFSVIINVPEEKAEDLRLKKLKPEEPWSIVNGPIKNFLFEALELKTTQIQLEIDNTGTLLLTRLHDRGTLIYELLENNPYPKILYDIRISLFFLNRAAKVVFTRRMGLENVKYGSVFVYKNGFRVHPFGEVGDDTLGVDRRKQQGAFRFLGSRELSGRIEINGLNPDFQETSSRDGGLIKNKHFDALKTLFFEYALKRLENFAVKLIKFGSLGEVVDLKNPSRSELQQHTFDLIAKLTDSKDVVDIRYDPNVLNIIENRSSSSVAALIKNLKRISLEQDNPDLSAEVAKAEKHIEDLIKAKAEAEAEAQRERERARQAARETEEAEEAARKAQREAETAEAAREAAQRAAEAAEDARVAAQQQADASKAQAGTVTTQNLFLKSVLSKDLEHVIELHHTISQDAKTIEQFAANLLGLLRDENMSLNRNTFREQLERISYVSRKITTVSRFATRANFRADTEEITTDLTAYIREYLLNIYGDQLLDPYHQKIAVEFIQDAGMEFVTRFTPIKVSIIFDNLISNSRKHKAKSINVSVIDQSSSKLVISYKDNGKGIPYSSIPYLFELGFTTTQGSGLGLYHSRNLMREMDGDITFNEHTTEGVEFILTFNKQGV